MTSVKKQLETPGTEMETETTEKEKEKRTKKEIPQELKDFLEASPKDYEINEVNVSRFCAEAREHGVKLTYRMVCDNFKVTSKSDELYLKWFISRDYLSNPIRKLSLKERIEELEAENKSLKAAIKDLVERGEKNNDEQ